MTPTEYTPYFRVSATADRGGIIYKENYIVIDIFLPFFSEIQLTGQ